MTTELAFGALAAGNVDDEKSPTRSLDGLSLFKKSWLQGCKDESRREFGETRITDDCERFSRVLRQGPVPGREE
jgi:hypothetical protein